MSYVGKEHTVDFQYSDILPACLRKSLPPLRVVADQASNVVRGMGGYVRDSHVKDLQKLGKCVECTKRFGTLKLSASYRLA